MQKSHRRTAVCAFSLAAIGLVAASTRADEPGRFRVFVPESESWSFGGGFSLDDELGSGGVSGGAKPQTAEIVKTIHERCPEAIVTRKEERADYVLQLQHEGGKVFVRKDNKYVVYDAAGDAIASGSTRSLGNAVKDACAAIRLDWRARSEATIAER
jgi:hypothetical protein